jgi:hypothetical protein
MAYVGPLTYKEVAPMPPVLLHSQAQGPGRPQPLRVQPEPA